MENLFQKGFCFGTNAPKSGYVQVTSTNLYNDQSGFGFITEENVVLNERYQIPELNSGFILNPSLVGQVLTTVITKESYCYSEQPNVPLLFKVSVPHSGNYKVTLTRK